MIVDSLTVTDWLVSFDVGHLLMQVQFNDTLELLKPLFTHPNGSLFHDMLTSMYFLFTVQYFDGEPPSIATCYREASKHRAQALDPLRPSCFYRFSKDTFVAWPH